jgi:hypothetical protein
MKLFAFVGTEISPETAFATFSDPEASYSFSLTIHKNDTKLEVMVGDQSCYRSNEVAVDLYRHYLVATLPGGTIDSIDGEDVYEIHFRIEGSEHAELVTTLALLLQGRGRLNVWER